MECTNLVDSHQLLCPWFTVVFVLFCIYTPDNLYPRPIVNQGGGLFWILSDFLGTDCRGIHMENSTNTTIIRNLAVPRHFVSYLVFFLVFVWTQDPTSLLSLKIRTPVANRGKLRFIGQMPVEYTSL